MERQLSILVFGFLLGIKHSFETDHVVAVTTIVSEHKKLLQAALVGTFWGMGHTTTLFVIGLSVLVLKIAIPQQISLFFEMIVGITLVVLGLAAIYRTVSFHIHVHTHSHLTHVHQHMHTNTSHSHVHKKSFLMGTLHGLAGSGALMLLVLSTIRNTMEGVIYILLFGIGSAGGMTVISLILGLPFLLSTQKFPNIQKYLSLVAGIISVVVGATLAYEIYLALAAG